MEEPISDDNVLHHAVPCDKIIANFRYDVKGDVSKYIILVTCTLDSIGEHFM